MQCYNCIIKYTDLKKKKESENETWVILLVPQIMVLVL